MPANTMKFKHHQSFESEFSKILQIENITYLLAQPL